MTEADAGGVTDEEQEDDDEEGVDCISRRVGIDS